MKEEKSAFDYPLFMFFVGPWVYLFLVVLTGYEIFYRNYYSDPVKRKKRVLWLSLGALFYLVLLMRNLNYNT